MNLNELIDKIREDSPAAVANLDERAMKLVLRGAFAVVAREVAAAPDGVHKFGGLGSFRVRTVEPKGAKPSARRVMFKAASSIPKKGKRAVAQ